MVQHNRNLGYSNQNRGGVAARKKIFAVMLVLLWQAAESASSRGYTFNEIVPDVRLPTALSGGSACPVPAHQLVSPASIALRWSTALGTAPVTIITQDQTASGRLSEVEQAIAQSLAVWTSVSGTSLTQSSLAPLTRIAAQNACGTDGINSICFDQADAAFTPGVLAFTRVITSDSIGQQVGSGLPATQLAQILDADVYLNPSNSHVTFATPAALTNSPSSYDLQSVLTHELGHFLGFSHSAVWTAMMYPYAPAPGTFTGTRPTTQQPDLPLGDDDRTGLRVLYPDPLDTLHVGTIAGRVLPANPLSLPLAPSGVTGVFGAHLVAIDSDSGAVAAGVLGGWSCNSPGPPQFDGSYEIDRLPIGHNYVVYAEPLDGTVVPGQLAPAINALCRNPATDPGWPAQQACVVPNVYTSFTTRVRPSP
jgi:hypothetical protein